MSPGWVLLVTAGYLVAVFGVARVGASTSRGRRWARHPVTYGLSLFVFLTTWTYLGNVELAAAGKSVFPIYLAFPLLFFIGAPLLERLVERAQSTGATSVADLMAARYGGSQAVASGTTALLALGLIPYLGVQLGGLAKAFDALAGSGGLAFALLFGGAIAVLAVRYGLQDMDAQEARPGLVASVAVESVIKLVVLFALAILLAQAAFPTPAALMARMDAAVQALDAPSQGALSSAVTAFSTSLIAVSALLMLPRQYYIATVQCPDPRYIRSAGRVAAVVGVGVNLALQPLGHAGAALLGEAAPHGTIILSAPLALGRPLWALAAFMALLCAAGSMLMVEITALSTMITNHLVLPYRRRRLQARISSRSLLKTRISVGASLVAGAFFFQLAVGSSHFMSSIGLISFASTTIFAIPLVAGLYDRRPCRSGAILGMGLGSLLWFYTLVVPAFARSGVLPLHLLEQGLFGWWWLKPEALLGVQGLSSVSHATAWIVGSSAAGLVLGRVLWPPSAVEQEAANCFVDPERFSAVFSEDGQNVRRRASTILDHLFDVDTAASLLCRSLERAGLENETEVLGPETVRLRRALERELAGSLGAATAHGILAERWPPPAVTDRDGLVRDYALQLVRLNLSPEELAERLAYEEDRKQLLDEQYAHLQRRIEERDLEIEERTRAEAALARLNEDLEHRVEERTEALARRHRELKQILESAGQGFVTVDASGEMSVERSEALSRWLDIDRASTSFVDALARHDPDLAEWVGSALETMRDPVVPPAAALGQLPAELRLGERELAAEYHLASEAENKVLVVLSDVSELRRQVEAEARRDEMLSLFEEAVTDPQAAASFLEEMSALVLGLARAEDVPALRCALHTFKGNARLRGLDAFAAQIHRIETRAEEAETLPVEGVEALAEQWRTASAFLARLVARLTSTAPRDQLALAELRATVAAGLEDAAVARAARRAVGGTLGPTFERLGQEAQRLARELGRAPVDVEIEGEDVAVDPEVAVPVSLALVHLVRNAVDHGLETPLERERAGKAARARVRLEAGRSVDEWWVEVGDDGRGIDTARLRARLGESELPTSDVFLRMLDDGVTTREEAAMVSGRGVGLSALRQEVQRLGGRVEVDSQAGRGTRFRVVFPRSGG